MSEDNTDRYAVVCFKDDQWTMSDPESKAGAFATAQLLKDRGYSPSVVLGEVAARGYLSAARGHRPPVNGPETYRGIQVPRELRPNWDRPEAIWWRRGVDAALAVMRPAVDALHYSGPCSLDHHGYCQEHGIGSIPCPDGEAQRLLEATKEEGTER